MHFEEFWKNGTELEWNRALEDYWKQVKPQNFALEKEFDTLDCSQIQSLTTETFYDWLYHKFFVWKYTAANRLATTRKKLEQYTQPPQEWQQLQMIQDYLFRIDPNNVQKPLNRASDIYGLGPAGASGLLAVLYPQYFGTVDKFVVQNLAMVPELHPRLPRSDKNLTIQHAAGIIEIFRHKSRELNTRFSTRVWTPRKIDMVLWGRRS